MKPMGRHCLTLLLAASTLPGLPLRAGEGDYSNLRFSGFLSVVGGKVLNGTPQGSSSDFVEGLPLYLADWSNWGVYTKSASLSPESRVGVQATARFTDDLSFTGQVVARGTDHKADLQWAYLSYKVSPNWELQVGRKRIPLYFYSEFQDIGIAYPWIAPPPELYGWDATNYNGASLRYRTTLGENALAASVFGGKETVKDNRYMISSGQYHTDTTWDHILGGDLEVTHDWLTVRGDYMKAKVTDTDKVDASNNVQQDMQAYSLALNADFGNWFILSEIGQNARTYNGYYLRAPAYSIGAGYRMGKWTPFLNFGEYREASDDPGYSPVNWMRPSFTLRYDLTASMDLKLQVDRYLEIDGTAYTADSTVLRLSFDWVF